MSLLLLFSGNSGVPADPGAVVRFTGEAIRAAGTEDEELRASGATTATIAHAGGRGETIV